MVRKRDVTAVASAGGSVDTVTVLKESAVHKLISTGLAVSESNLSVERPPKCRRVPKEVVKAMCVASGNVVSAAAEQALAQARTSTEENANGSNEVVVTKQHLQQIVHRLMMQFT